MLPRVQELPHAYDVQIVGLVASPGHRYDGRPGGVVPEQDGDRRQEIEVRAGHGVVGDRYAGRPAHRDAQLTLLAAEAVETLAAELGTGPLDPLLARRTVVLRGAEVEALRGEEFSLDCGSGEVRLRGGRPANPCAWLDTALAPGAHRGLRGRAGIRCAALSAGVLRLGPAVLRSAVPLDPAAAGVPVRPAPRRR
jgi:MOSC domain-containing protein YiiM